VIACPVATPLPLDALSGGGDERLWLELIRASDARLWSFAHMSGPVGGPASSGAFDTPRAGPLPPLLPGRGLAASRL
jgi:hypothetical protein